MTWFRPMGLLFRPAPIAGWLLSLAALVFCVNTFIAIVLGILYDEQGRRMKIHGGTGRSTYDRYYKSEYTSWSRDDLTRRVMVAGDRTEQLAISALAAFLGDRVELKNAVLSLGLYSDEIRRLLRMGPRAAKRLAK